MKGTRGSKSSANSVGTHGNFLPSPFYVESAFWAAGGMTVKRSHVSQ
jgi:hypothetical protein